MNKNLAAICPHPTNKQWLLGIALSLALAMVSLALAKLPFLLNHGLGSLTLAIILGMLLGNTIYPRLDSACGKGVLYSKAVLLRAGIILYGFRINFQSIYSVGMAAIITDLVIICCTFFLARYLGRKLFHMEDDIASLIGIGASICGAAAVMAAEPVLKPQPHKVAVAVATVVVFGTISMFIYPLLYPFTGFSEYQYGVYTGSTVHEVAQVVVAGNAAGDLAGANAVIVKMIRVMLLVPFLIFLSALVAKQQNKTNLNNKSKLTIPWFAIFFIAASAFNSLELLPEAVRQTLSELSTIFMCMAMAALGLHTHVSAVRQAGMKPLFLAFMLFIFLVFGGWVINRLVWELPFIG